MLISDEMMGERIEKLSIMKKKRCDGRISLTSEGKSCIFFRSAAQTKFQD